MDRSVQTNLGYFGVLPIELVLHVFGYLDGKDLLLNANARSLHPFPLNQKISSNFINS